MSKTVTIDTTSPAGSYAEALKKPNQIHIIELPFPPSSLSGHNTGDYYAKAPIVAKHREWARVATKAAKATVCDGKSDILFRIDFFPPDNRGDRVNYPNRMKPYIDGVADALGVNDKRFLPSYHYHAPGKPGKVTVTI